MAESPAAAHASPGLLTRWLLPLLLCLQVGIEAVQLPHAHVDVDTWWHLRVGERIAESGTVPTTDPFSRHGLQTGKPWYAYSWLYELILYSLWAQFGMHGVVLFRTVQAFAVGYAWFLFCTRRSVSVLWTGLLFIVGYLAFFHMTLSERPWLFSMIASMWTLHVVLAQREGKPGWTDWLLPLAYVVWANWHIQFIYGFPFLALGVAAPLLDGQPGEAEAWTAKAWGSPLWRRLACIAALCLLATLANPFHVRIYAVVHDYATQPGAFAFVYELMAPDFRRREDWICLGFAALALFVVARQPRVSWFNLLLVVGPAVAGLRAKRDEWYLLLGAVAVLQEAELPWLTLPPAPPLSVRARLLLALGLAALAAGVSFRTPGEDEFVQDEAKCFPAAAVAHVRQNGYPGPLLNHFDWGGYLIWRLKEHPVAMDGRTNLHGDDRIAASIDAFFGKPGWEALPELAEARLAIVQQDKPLAQLLRHDARFRLVYEDKLAAVFVRREAGGDR